MDFLADENNDLVFTNGDLTITTDNRGQLISNLVEQGKGNFKQNPLLCYNMRQLINSPFTTNDIKNNIKLELERDNFFNIKIEGELSDLKIKGDRNDI